MKIHLLDVGPTKYGDCILISHDGRHILIDGGHTGDTDRITAQLKKLMDREPPFNVELLIVTHCHEDHIGCLPALVKSETLTADVAVVADERFGWGRDANDDAPVDALNLNRTQKALVATLLEEDHSDLPVNELEQFLQDAANLESRYRDTLQQLGDQGTRIVRYGRDSAAQISQVESHFNDFGLKFLGPTRDHLVKCAAYLAQLADALGNEVLQDSVTRDDSPSIANAYKRLVKRFARTRPDDPEFASDQPGPGAAKNDQSIVIKVAADDWSALLAGDMQFVKAEVPGLTPMMKVLRDVVLAAGPYDFVKLTHHSSYNGVDETLIDEFAHTQLFAHTGGKNDPKHPDPAVLEMLKGRSSQLRFARTDHNGLITVAKEGGKVTMDVSRGRLNDFTPNPGQDTLLVAREATAAGAVQLGQPSTASQRATSPVGRDGDVVEIRAFVPHADTRVTITIEVDPGKKKPLTNGVSSERRVADGSRIGGGSRQSMPRLLFVTNQARLSVNIGKSEANSIIDAVRGIGTASFFDIPEGVANAEAAARLVRPQLSPDLQGVVILGGYDVVPPYRLDVLDGAARAQVRAEGLERKDSDLFIVWSDELYGDRDGDFIAELPISRVPDARQPGVILAALQARPFAQGARFGLHNIVRPFAKEVFPIVPGSSSARLEASEKFEPAHVANGSAQGAVYLMLHGSARDGSRFWGEVEDSGEVCEAINVDCIPDAAPGSVVFCGCCWGALIGSPQAAAAKPETQLRPRTAEDSMAVAYLRSGASAFVGCTGTHYSPLRAPYNFFGRPMHESFWRYIAAGKAPSEALFLAKRDYARGMPHGLDDTFGKAVEMKILRQFTCLGLGW